MWPQKLIISTVFKYWGISLGYYKKVNGVSDINVVKNNRNAFHVKTKYILSSDNLPEKITNYSHLSRQHIKLKIL